jgi:hypothetical protein
MENPGEKVIAALEESRRRGGPRARYEADSMHVADVKKKSRIAVNNRWRVC